MKDGSQQNFFSSGDGPELWAYSVFGMNGHATQLE